MKSDTLITDQLDQLEILWVNKPNGKHSTNGRYQILDCYQFRVSHANAECIAAFHLTSHVTQSDYYLREPHVTLSYAKKLPVHRPRVLEHFVHKEQIKIKNREENLESSPVRDRSQISGEKDISKSRICPSDMNLILFVTIDCNTFDGSFCFFAFFQMVCNE